MYPVLPGSGTGSQVEEPAMKGTRGSGQGGGEPARGYYFIN